MGHLKLYMMILGCKPQGRHTEQHDVFFTVATSMKETVPAITGFWPEASGKLHVDAWREVTEVDGFKIEITEKKEQEKDALKLFFINLGGYKKGEFDELHYKMLVVAANLANATQKAKQTAFYQHTGFSGAVSHIDDKYGVDVDDAVEILEILPREIKEKYSLQITQQKDLPNDEINLGYFPLNKI
ncbi:DUF1543 domain-containing protein [Pedobacter nutrimenti]|uniref:Uncharacterized protein DUF1543 n=1 Tax=Pedobacter nutrimenti TaxID=1241337 RepID=A0A318UHQ5_9SPHI|nr:DUF1543 domain-containing protein [Pedobacter nutrimenti]PYF75954.1 uncharacterized protein DUF1543 [Pedobacter nutrimenti]